MAEFRKKIAFIGSECYPFVKTGGLGDVMYALPKALTRLGCEVRVFLPRYRCIPDKFQEQMKYRGEFYMDLCADGRKFYTGIMEYEADGVVYEFIDNQDFFTAGKPYTNLYDDIPKYCFFSKAALSAMLFMDWIPEIIHCHDWQAALVPVYLRTMFYNSKLDFAKTILTIHNLRFQGICSVDHMKYWSGLPAHIFSVYEMTDGSNSANMMKGGLTFADVITTVSRTYADEIQTEFYGENLEAHLSHLNYKLTGIVNGIDCDIWNPETDSKLSANYSVADVLSKKPEDKMHLQDKLGLEVNEDKFVIGLISRLTDQKGLDLINAIMPWIVDGNTQVVVLGTGDKTYEASFSRYEEEHPGEVCSCIMYDEALSHEIYAGADALLVPSLFEPCGLTQLIAMRYGTVPIVRETGGLKDTVEPYNRYTNEGNGFTFDYYQPELLLDAINRAKTVYFEDRIVWDEMVQRDLNKDVSWENSAKLYLELYEKLNG